MKVIQIANDFCNTKVHSNLFKALDRLGVQQTIYNAVRFADKVGRNQFESQHATFVYRFIVKPWHKYFFHIKARCVYKDLVRLINVADYQIVHASTLFTDGVLAYKLYKRYHIPYVVAVRNTDINGFLERAPHTWLDGRKILLNASKIIFISRALCDKFKRHRVIKPIFNRIEHKIVIKPNGIDSFFLDHIDIHEHHGRKVIYIGNFSNNKNVIRTCEAILNLRKIAGYEDVTITLVGGGKEKDERIHTLINNNPSAINYVGPIFEREELVRILRDHKLFVMTSIHETFGLVYVEALSQNLPIVYTKGQGVDRMFDSTAGIAVNPLDVDEIMYAVKTIIDKSDCFSNKNIPFDDFRWENIAKYYVGLYNEVVNAQ